MTDLDEVTMKLIAKHFGLEKVDEDADLFDDLNGDALDVIELVMELEEEYNIAISDSEAESFKLVQDVCRCVNEKIATAVV